MTERDTMDKTTEVKKQAPSGDPVFRKFNSPYWEEDSEVSVCGARPIEKPKRQA